VITKTCVMSLLSRYVSSKNYHRSHIKGKRLQRTHSVNYFQSWYIGTTNKLLQTPLWLNRPHHHYQIIHYVFYQQWFRWHGRWCIDNSMTNPILTLRKKATTCLMKWWHTNRYNRCSMKRVMMMIFFGFESILLGSTPGWFIGPKFGAIFLFQSPKPLLQHSLLVGLITATLLCITLHRRIV